MMIDYHDDDDDESGTEKVERTTTTTTATNNDDGVVGGGGGDGMGHRPGTAECDEATNGGCCFATIGLSRGLSACVRAGPRVTCVRPVRADRRLALPAVGGATVGRCLRCAAPWDDYDPALCCTGCRSLVLLCPICRIPSPAGTAGSKQGKKQRSKQGKKQGTRGRRQPPFCEEALLCEYCTQLKGDEQTEHSNGSDGGGGGDEAAAEGGDGAAPSPPHAELRERESERGVSGAGEE
jgi:hypothetical protein